MMNERILVGSRACFGIELEVASLVAGVWADVLLWIGGESLGREEDAFALYPLLGTMDGLLKMASDDASTSEMLSLPAGAAWSRFEALEGKYSVHTCYLFDRYEVCCVSDYRIARFLWRSRYLEVVVLHDARVPRSEIARVAEELHVVHERLSRES
jgi:hypothetical protein